MIHTLRVCLTLWIKETVNSRDASGEQRLEQRAANESFWNRGWELMRAIRRRQFRFWGPALGREETDNVHRAGDWIRRTRALRGLSYWGSSSVGETGIKNRRRTLEDAAWLPFFLLFSSFRYSLIWFSYHQKHQYNFAFFFSPRLDDTALPQCEWASHAADGKRTCFRTW